MDQLQREEIFRALHHGFEDDRDLDDILLHDLRVLEPIIDRFLEEAWKRGRQSAEHA